MVSLIFSSIFKHDLSGRLVNDLAEEYSISEDSKSYTVKIRNGVSWHNGRNLTVDDIIFTLEAMRDKQYKSTWRATFAGVKVEKIDEQSLRFILNEPYAAFLELLTFGILPQELWQEIQPASADLAELNIKPIGSGPYKFKSLTKDKSGLVKNYSLVANDNYYLATPHIVQLNFKFFTNIEEAVESLNQGKINGISYLPKKSKENVLAKNSLNFYELNIPQVTAIFFNLKSSQILAEKSVRQALAYALDKEKILEDFFQEGAKIIDGPILPESFAYNQQIKKYNFDTAIATAILDQAGWKEIELKSEDIALAEQEENSTDEKVRYQSGIKQVLGVGKWRAKKDEFLYFRLSVINTEEYSSLAEFIALAWEKIGVKVQIELIPASQFQALIIKEKNFDALIYSKISGADPDPYAFWHSSQIDQAGMNIASYNNKKADQLLEDGRLTIDQSVRQEKYKEFQQIISEDLPAIFLFRPTYTYVLSKEIRGFSSSVIYLPHDRFNGINNWHTKTAKKLIF